MCKLRGFVVMMIFMRMMGGQMSKEVMVQRKTGAASTTRDLGLGGTCDKC